jgi:hypothetical protein
MQKVSKFHFLSGKCCVNLFSDFTAAFLEAQWIGPGRAVETEPCSPGSWYISMFQGSREEAGTVIIPFIPFSVSVNGRK